MSRKPSMYVPSSFTADEGVQLINCTVTPRSEMESANLYKTHFDSNEIYENWIVYTEDAPIDFIDKLESHTKQEERLT